MIVSCHFCGQTSDEAHDMNPFIMHNGIAICYECIFASLIQIKKHWAGEMEYRSWLK